MEGRFAQRLREARLARGLSLHELGRRAHIGAGYLSYLESGRRPAPPGPRVRAIARALGVDEGELVALAGRDRIERAVAATIENLWHERHPLVLEFRRLDGKLYSRLAIGEDVCWMETPYLPDADVWEKDPGPGYGA